MTSSLPTVSTITQNLNTGKFMSIMNNPKFRGSFIHNGQEYANYQSALAAAGLDTRFRSVGLQPKQPEIMKLACNAFVSPSGQYYVVVRCGLVDVRIDCHNSHTARAWQRDGVSVASFREALEEEGNRNVRTAGGWGTC